MKRRKLNPKELKARALYVQAHAQQVFTLFLRIALLGMAFLVITGIAHGQKYQGKYFNNVDTRGVILEGYDPVAFFIDNKPVKGDPKYQFRYQDALYYFADAGHLEQFKSDPEKFKPQFGGWCAYAVSLGRIAPIDVNTFSIVNGRLFIQHNQRAVNGWNKDVAGNIIKADKYWPAVAAGGGRQITTDEEKAYLNNTDRQGVILQGYDAVAYFTDNKAVKGNPQFTARFHGATYWFSSEDHASLFKDNPEKYTPQYGAFCGYAMSLNKLRPIDPTIFQFVDGRLILQHTADAYERFNKDVAENTQKADRHWPGQVKKHAGRKVKFDKPAEASPENTGMK